MDEEIKITAQVEPGSAKCRFAIDRPLLPQGSLYFSNKEKAEGAALAERLFEIETLAAVQISGAELTITMTQPTDWKAMAKRIAEIVRAQIRSGEPAVPLGFKLPSMPDSEIKAIVQELFETQINPAVAQHGGSVDLIDVKDNKIYLQMSGGCHGCASATATLRQGIEVAIREKLPDVAEILDVTDHASGSNPYY